MQFNIGWFLHPLFIDGDYPSIMKTRIEEIRTKIEKPDQGLPEFSEEEKIENLGSCDFIRIVFNSKLPEVLPGSSK